MGCWGVTLLLLDYPAQAIRQQRSMADLKKVPPASPATLAFTGVTIVDLSSGQHVRDQTIVVVGRQIRAVGVAGRVRVPAGARVIAAQRKYAVPGLWDMHIHPGRYPHIFYPLLIANGVAGIREAGTNAPLDSVLRWPREIAAGVRVGPRSVTSGPTLIASDEGRALCRPSCPGGLRLVTTSDEVRYVVDSLKTAGADFIKTHSEAPPREIYFAIAAENAPRSDGVVATQSARRRHRGRG